MSISINGFGGPLTWFFRKHFSFYLSGVVLEMTSKIYEKRIMKYIDFFKHQEKDLLFKMVNIETVNRCNGTCAFCPANVKSEQRELKKMSSELFQKIVMELKDLDWQGQLFLNVNNEPLMDKDIIERAKMVKNQLGENVIVSMITNGSLLSIDKLESLRDSVDHLVINNYGDSYKLKRNNKKIYQYVKKNRKKFKDIKIIINRRYVREILATRAGSAPNKKKRNNNVVSPCIYPYTDITIFPDGKVGLCCNDCFEITDYGNVNEQSLIDIWYGDKFKEVRDKMRFGRLNFPFCVECDVVDSGYREKLIKIK